MDADLVLEGGGVKGIALVGAISVLEEQGYRFHRVAGTSAGAIVASLVVAGVRASELAEIMRSLDYRRFRDGSFLDRLGWPGKGLSLLLHDGIYRGDYVREWLGGLLAGHGARSFADVRADDPDGSMPAGQDYRLVVMTSDISEGSLRRLPWDYAAYGCAPDEMAIADAVRASMSIPYFYRPVKLTDRDLGKKCWLVDGGMLSNYPIDVFDRRDGRAPRWPTLGVKLSARPDDRTLPNDVHGLVSMTRAMIGTMTGFYDHLHLDDPGTVARTIFVDTFGVDATDFDIDGETQQRLYHSGREAATKFLAHWDFTDYLARYRADFPVSEK